MTGPQLHRTRPPKPTFTDSRIIRACPVRVLPPGHKMIWEELLHLDHSEEGAFISATSLAERVGMGVDNVEKIRRELVALGLLVMVRPERRRTASWYAVLPEGCSPHTARPTADEVRLCAEALESWILRRRDGGGPADGLADQRPPVTPRQPRPTGGSASAIPPRPGPGNGVPASANASDGAAANGVCAAGDRGPTGVPASANSGPNGVPEYAPELVVNTEISDLLPTQEDGGAEEGGATRPESENGRTEAAPIADNTVDLCRLLFAELTPGTRAAARQSRTAPPTPIGDVLDVARQGVG